MAVGSRRFQVRGLRSGTAYLRASVSWLPESDGPLTAEGVQAARMTAVRYLDRLASITGRADETDLPQDPGLLSYHIAGQLPLAPAERQRLLATPTTAQRLARATVLLRRELRLLESTRSIALSPSVLRLVADPN